MSRVSIVTLILISFMSGAVFISQCTKADQPGDVSSSESSHEPAEAELAGYMGRLQYYTHKLALSVEAENAEAAGFYLHEMEELTEAIQINVPEYEGHNIAVLTEAMLEPTLIVADSLLEAGDWDQARSGLITLVDACNTCHKATRHGFVEVAPGFGKNPFNQNF